MTTHRSLLRIVDARSHLRTLIRCAPLFILLFGLAIATATASAANAQSAAAPVPTSAASPATPAEPPTDPLGRETPRGTVTGLLVALARQDYTAASDFLQPLAPKSKPEKTANLARFLKASLDNGGELLPYAQLSNDPLGRRDDQLPPDREQVGTLGDAQSTPIVLVRSEPAGSAPIWQVSKATLAHLKQAPPPPEQVDEALQIAGAPLLDWLKLLGLAAGSFLFYWLITSALLWLTGKLLTGARSKFLLHFVQAGLPPLSLLLAVITVQISAQNVDASIIARQAVVRYIGIAGWFALAWFALRLIDTLTGLTTLRMERNERRQAASMVALIRRALKIMMVAVAALAIFDTLGFDVTTGIAALGIGGIALALGAQKTVENLVGCITVIADRPVEAGDFCRVGDTLGTVSDIGIRSTRIRTIERTEVTIPNSDFASGRIENYSRRDQFLFNPRIGLVYDTDAAGMREALRLIREVLATNEAVVDDGARARFVDFGASSLDIEIFAYIARLDYAESLEVREELLLAIMEALENGGFSIAFPTQTLNLQGEVKGRLAKAEETAG